MTLYSSHKRGRAAVALLTLSATLATLFAANAAPAQAAPRVHTIVMNRMAYGPAPARLRAGDIILWVNRDLFRHTATARDRSFNVDLAPGASTRMVVRRAGMINYFCRYHPGMRGQLAVAR